MNSPKMATKEEKKKTAHPGEILWSDFMVPLKITATQLSQATGVPLGTVEEIIQKKAPVTPDIAIRLSRYLDNAVQFWLNQQAEYEVDCLLEQARAAKSNDYDSIRPVKKGSRPSKRNSKQPQHIRNVEELREFLKSGSDNDIVLSKTFFDGILEHPFDSNAQEWIQDEKTKNCYLRFMLNFLYEKDENASLLYEILQKHSCTVTIETPIFPEISHETALYAYAVRKLCSCLFKQISNTELHPYDYFPLLYGLRAVNKRYVMIWGHQVGFEESSQANEIKVLLDNIREELTIPAKCKTAGRTPIDEDLIRNAFQRVFAHISGGSLSDIPRSYLKKVDISGVQMEEEIIKHMVWLWKALTEGDNLFREFWPRRKNEKYFKPLSSKNCEQVREILLVELAIYIESSLAIFLQYFDAEKASQDISYSGIKQLQITDGWAVGFEITAGASTLKIVPSISIEKLKKLRVGYSIPEICRIAAMCRRDNKHRDRRVYEQNLSQYLYDKFRNEKTESLPSERSTTGKGQGNAHKYPLEAFEAPIKAYRGGDFVNLYAEIVAQLDWEEE